MNSDQLRRMREDKGFVAALDQSGGSTPGALELYGIGRDAYENEAQMDDLVHAMRTRVVTSPGFTGDHILAVILFDKTMRRKVDGQPTPAYLWNKRIVPFLKIDQGMEDPRDGAQLMRPMPDLPDRLADAAARGIFGTKMRSVIHAADPAGIAAVAAQQFDLADRILAAGLVPIVEPEVDIRAPDKDAAEAILKDELRRGLDRLPQDADVIFKLSLPSRDDFYRDLMDDPRVVRVVALSGGYSRAEADARLARNHGMIASFSRALLEGLRADQTDEAFDSVLSRSVREIYHASIT